MLLSRNSGRKDTLFLLIDKEFACYFHYRAINELLCERRM